MTPQPNCPDRETLARLLLGKLPSGSAERLESHLLQCDACSKLAETINDTDDVTIAFASEESFGDDEDILADIIQRAKQLHSQAETGERLVNAVASSPNMDREFDFLAPAEQPDEIGRLGEYRVLEVLGAGGMGVVFLAEDLKLHRQVALKVMKSAVATSKTAKDRFVREAQATAAIQHKNIVTIFQVSDDQHVPFIAMQYLPGESLQKRLKREQQLGQREVLRIGREVAAGLEAAHARELIHRDIKPDNIWLDAETGQVKILDFGLVRAATDEQGLTQSDMVLGTPRYMAPEQAQGQTVDHRCDLFSLGSVLYQLVTGKTPFEGANLTATLIAVAQEDPAPVEQVRPDIEPDFSHLIMRLLSKNPDQRPQSASEVTKAIAEIERKLPAERAERGKQQQVAGTTVLSRSPVPVSKTGFSKPILFGGATVAVALSILFGLWSADFIFKSETEEGTLVVKVTGNDFATSAQGKQVTIKNTETNETFTITLDTQEETKSLKPGRYQFLLSTDSGLATKTDRITIHSGKGQVVEVWWEPKVPQSVVTQTSGTLKHVPFDLFYEDPQPVIGIREIPATVFGNDLPELNLDAGAVNDTSQLRIVRLWFQTEDLVPSVANSNLYLPRTIKAWVPSQGMPQGSVEVVREHSNGKVVSVRPRSRLADGVYCLVEGRIGDGAILSRFSAPFTVRGIGKPTIDMNSVSVEPTQVILRVTIRNHGKGTLNDGRLVITLQRVTSEKSVFSGRFQPKLAEIPPGETRDVELEVSTENKPPGRYYFTIAVRQTHWNGDQNELVEGNSEEFKNPSSATREQ